MKLSISLSDRTVAVGLLGLVIKTADVSLSIFESVTLLAP